MFPVILARARMPMIIIGLLLAFGEFVHRLGWLSVAGIVLALAGFASTFLPAGSVRRPPIPVASPVRGRWLAINSPADKVPSHGVHAYGQTYAVDLVHWPDEDIEWKPVVSRPLMSRPETFPGFGSPIHAPAAGTVVRARDFWRDHLSRNSWPALIYVMIEGFVRELAGPGGVLGNHVILDLGDGVHAVFAHLKRGSVQVRKGERVEAGRLVGQCGNSGNSSEPHLHFQLMDNPHPSIAAGLPFTFEETLPDGTTHHRVPSKDEPLLSPSR
ncbi:M23 family metallopeptidase [Nonomuraea mesophila]|uniref:M23 family metallopeptidase n=1 Tax=Nonomuraea mesophila TaxID=2530382 RepID=A0A4R5ETK5_9ACTN|nr:M23 family metallopeptidase [Nonomuraea mesophila]TDE38225.1 M23 family metallopeptidase [Nonomuraea mesophila]